MSTDNDAKTTIIVLLPPKTYMMKKLQLLIAFILTSFFAKAQDVSISEGMESMGKTERWCFSAKYPFKKDIAEAVMEKNIERAGLKRNSSKKGVNTYKAAVWTEISDSKCDYYYKLKSKKGRTTILFSVSKGYDNYVTSGNDVSTSNNIKQYMLHLQDQMQTAAQIEEEEAKLKKMANQNAETKAELEKASKEQAEKEEKLKALKRKQ